MGSAQLITVLGGLVMLSLLGLSFYSSYRAKLDVNYYNEVLITATGVGESMLEKIMTRAFDEKTITKAVTSTDSLTTAGSIGTDAGETAIHLYDDIDDFNNYSKIDTLSIYGQYKTFVKVRYVQKMNPNTISNTRTFSKRIDVKVINNYLNTDTVRLYHIVTY
ncbi:MAG: hypothetical protein FD143_2410 [Ignavibacteria bacterium]|nr:MAG: hypothetical protein FD143_2410 [Ignavibacteria bacterium]KAF0157175.1 MAG: hypothetical protein FD188_2816 [Ignavibacteria bacterium]